MPGDKNNPDTLPADFFSKPVSVNPDTLPADFFTTQNASGHGQPAAPPSDGLAGEWWKQVNPLAAGNAIIDLVRNPGQAFRAYTGSTDELRQKAAQAWQQGDYAGAAAHALNYVLNGIPGVGTALNDAGEKMKQGDIAGGTGETLGVATNLLGPMAAGKLIGKLGPAAQSIRGAFESDPAVGMVRALSPAASNSRFADVLPSAMQDIKEAGGGNILGLDHLRAASKIAMNNNQAALESWMARARDAHVSVPGNSIIAATEDAIPDVMRRENPTLANSISKTVQRAYSGRLSVDQLRQLLEEKNAELDSFYDKTIAKQQASVISGAPEAVVKAQRDEIANLLYNALDPEHQGAGPREIQSRYQAIKEVSDVAEKRRNAALSEKPLTGAGAAGKTLAAVADFPGKVFHGDTEGAIQGLTKARQGTIDPLIRDSFKAVGQPSPYPVPSPRVVNFRGLLSQGDIITPAPADTSFVRGVPAVPNPPNPARALPAPATVTPPPADPSFVRGYPGMANPPNPARALPQQTQIVTPPPADTSFVRAVPAERGLPVRDPLTGRMKRVYLSPDLLKLLAERPDVKP